MFFYGYRFYLVFMGGFFYRIGNKGVVENGLFLNGRYFYVVYFSKIYYNCNMKVVIKFVFVILNFKFKSFEIFIVILI